MESQKPPRGGSKGIRQKIYPIEFEATKEVRFYPENLVFDGDVLEIGPGRGDFLLSQAEKAPSTKFVAVEIGKKRFHRMIPRIEKRGLKNILLIRGDARVVLPRFFKGHSFQRIYVLFPDPWPKARHAFKRLLQVDFLRLLSGYLAPQGELIIGTDVKSYASWVADNLKDIPELENEGNPFLNRSPFPSEQTTFFEEKWRQEGRTIHFIRCLKR